MRSYLVIGSTGSSAISLVTAWPSVWWPLLKLMPENTLAVAATAAGQGPGISVAPLVVYSIINLVRPALSPHPKWQSACRLGQQLFAGECQDYQEQAHDPYGDNYYCYVAFVPLGDRLAAAGGGDVETFKGFNVTQSRGTGFLTKSSSRPAWEASLVQVSFRATASGYFVPFEMASANGGSGVENCVGANRTYDMTTVLRRNEGRKLAAPIRERKEKGLKSIFSRRAST